MDGWLDGCYRMMGQKKRNIHFLLFFVCVQILQKREEFAIPMNLSISRPVYYRINDDDGKMNSTCLCEECFWCISIDTL